MSIAVAETTPLFVAGEPSAQRALIVIQEAFGVNDHIREVCERFATQGYYVVAPLLYHRSGSPEIAYDDFPEAMTHMGQLNAADIETDLRASSQFLVAAGYPASSTGIIGYCMGGTVTCYAATLGIVGAAAPYYGSGLSVGRFGLPAQIESAPRIACPVIGFYGDLDAGIPIDQVEALREALHDSAQPTEVVRYPEAQHGFHCDGRPNNFNEAAASDAYGRTLAFFDTHLETA
jgi:carboxymethylenebutenolidase